MHIHLCGAQAHSVLRRPELSLHSHPRWWAWLHLKGPPGKIAFQNKHRALSQAGAGIQLRLQHPERASPGRLAPSLHVQSDHLGFRPSGPPSERSSEMHCGRSRTQPGAWGGASCLHTFLRDSGRKEGTDGPHAARCLAQLRSGVPRSGQRGLRLRWWVWTGSAQGPGTDSILSVSADLALRVRTASGESPTCYSVVSNPGQRPGRQGTRGPSCSVSHHPRPQRRPHARVQPRRAAWRVLLLRPEEEGGRWDRRP